MQKISGALRKNAIRLLYSMLGLVALIFFVVNLLALPVPSNMTAPIKEKSLVIVDVNIVDPRDYGSLLRKQMVVISSGKIMYAGEHDKAKTPLNSRIIIGTEKYLIPGLWDSHIHSLRLSPQLHFPLLVANGVTSVRDMGDACSWSNNLDCKSNSPNWHKKINAGEIVGPRIIETTSYHMESLPKSDEDLIKILRALKAKGEGTLKIQLEGDVKQEDFQKLIKAAKQRNFKIIGHLPYSIEYEKLAVPLSTIEHDTSLLPQCSDAHLLFDGKNSSKEKLLTKINKEKCRQILKLLGQAKTAYVPTHVASTGQDLSFSNRTSLSDGSIRKKYVVAPLRFEWSLIRYAGEVDADEEMILSKFHKSALGLTKAAHENNVNVLAGTDSLDADVIHGFSLHEELSYLTRAGLTPSQALYSATLGPAKHFGMQDWLGTVEQGKAADLVLLDANPLINIQNTKKINLVIADGRVYDSLQRNKLFQYVENQVNDINTICRFIRGLWYDDI